MQKWQIGTSFFSKLQDFNFSMFLPALPLSKVPLLGNRGAFAPAGVSSAGGPTSSTYGLNVTLCVADSSAPASSFAPWGSLDGGGKRHDPLESIESALNQSNLH